MSKMKLAATITASVLSLGAMAQKPAYVQLHDFHLPSGLLWASDNLGAKDKGLAHDDYGDYYSWGETTTKADYSREQYKFYNGIDAEGMPNAYTAYNAEDLRVKLRPEDDAATVQWGAGYRIPTQADWQELMDYCEWKAGYSTNYVMVYRIMAINSTDGVALFLPMSGMRFANVPVPMLGGSDGEYWCADLSAESRPSEAPFVHTSQSFRGFNPTERHLGLTIRPVYDPKIVGIDATHTDREASTTSVTYTLDGRRATHSQQGLMMQVMSNGEKRMVVK